MGLPEDDHQEPGGRELQLIFHEREDLRFVRKLARLQFGVDQVAIERNFETATRVRNEFQSRDLLTVRIK